MIKEDRDQLQETKRVLKKLGVELAELFPDLSDENAGGSILATIDMLEVMVKFAIKTIDDLLAEKGE